jgi:heme exporter protein CcmD
MMGEYAIFVWSCYGAVVVVMTALAYLSWKSKKSDEKLLDELNRQLEEMNAQDK